MKMTYAGDLITCNSIDWQLVLGLQVVITALPSGSFDRKRHWLLAA